MLIVTLPVANMPQQAIALPLDDVHGNSNKLAAGSIMTTDGFLRPPNPGEALLAEHGMDLGENDLTMGALDIPEELRYNKWLMAVQCVLSTLFCTTVLLSEFFLLFVFCLEVWSLLLGGYCWLSISWVAFIQQGDSKR